MEHKTILIIGCGWLGFSFAKSMKEKGWKIKASTTSKEKLRSMQDSGIDSSVLQFPTKEKINIDTFQVDYLLISFPPGRKDNKSSLIYQSAIEQIIGIAKKSSKLKKIIFISSTSVYEKNANQIDEGSITNPTSISGRKILMAENIIRKSIIPYVILRFGGLVGPERHPGRFLAGKAGLSNANQSINLLHLNDAVGVITYMVEHAVENEIFNVVSPIHYPKKEFYAKMSLSIDLQPPEFIEATNKVKSEISVDRLLNMTDYNFIYPDPMKFIY